jgi:hypothetical protein
MLHFGSILFFLFIFGDKLTSDTDILNFLKSRPMMNTFYSNQHGSLDDRGSTRFLDQGEI